MSETEWYWSDDGWTTDSDKAKQIEIPESWRRQIVVRIRSQDEPTLDIRDVQIAPRLSDG